jgi:hypothetical protein
MSNMSAATDVHAFLEQLGDPSCMSAVTDVHAFLEQLGDPLTAVSSSDISQPGEDGKDDSSHDSWNLVSDHSNAWHSLRVLVRSSVILVEPNSGESIFPDQKCPKLDPFKISSPHFVPNKSVDAHFAPNKSVDGAFFVVDVIQSVQRTQRNHRCGIVRKKSSQICCLLIVKKVEETVSFCDSLSHLCLCSFAQALFDNGNTRRKAGCVRNNENQKITELQPN